MFDQIGYSKPHNFIESPQEQWGTKRSMRGLWNMGDHKAPWGILRGSLLDHTGLLKTKWDHGGPYRTIGGSYGELKDPWL